MNKFLYDWWPLFLGLIVGIPGGIILAHIISIGVEYYV